MIILREKEYGQKWEGFKGAVKGARTGALIGGIVAPGNLIALATGNPKTALGITAAGATIGAGIGARSGWKEGVSKWKYDNDPEYRKKVDDENKAERAKNIKNSREEDHVMASEFSYSDWAKLAKDLKTEKGWILPDEVLRYIKFYETKWKKKIDTWYDNLPPVGDPWEVAEFKYVFPMPYVAKISKEWLGYDNVPEIILLTDNDAGDDGWVAYNFETGTYTWDGRCRPSDLKTLKEFLSRHASRCLNDEILSEGNKKLIQEYIRSL